MHGIWKLLGQEWNIYHSIDNARCLLNPLRHQGTRQVLLLATNTNSYFHWNDKLTSLIFEKMFGYCLNNHSLLPVAPSGKNDILWKVIWELTNKSHKCFSSRQPTIIPQYTKKYFIWTSHFTLLILKKCTQGPKLNKLIVLLLHQGEP